MRIYYFGRMLLAHETGFIEQKNWNMHARILADVHNLNLKKA